MRVVRCGHLLLLFLASFATSWASASGNSFEDPRIHPLSLDPTSEERLIEPTSPILGSRLAAFLRDNQTDPEEILADLKNQDLQLTREIALSVITYISTLQPGATRACQQAMADSVEPARGWKIEEEGAIPYDVLEPLHPAYLQQAKTLLDSSRKWSTEKLLAQAKQISANFRQYRLDCNGPKKLEHIETLLSGICQTPVSLLNGNLTGCLTLATINNQIMAPELAYPRAEFSINGFTRYVYGELFKLSDLRSLLHATWMAEKEWLSDVSEDGRPPESFLSFVQKKLHSQGFSPRESLLVLSYSTRNMPSLDVEYGQDPETALLMEIYFWQFHKIREALKGPDLAYDYPNHVFKSDPGVYHYLTSAFQACELKGDGYNSVIAIGSSLIMAAGYKTDKLISAIAWSQILHQGPEYVTNLAQKQGFVDGVETGLYGGEYGSKICSQ